MEEVLVVTVNVVLMGFSERMEVVAVYVVSLLIF